MIRKWFINLFREVLAQELLSVHTLLGEVLMNQAKILNSQANVETQTRASAKAHDGSGIQNDQMEAPISTSRSSWPRMKRQFEEADVRKIIEQQREAPDSRAAAQFASRMSEEAARLEKYWREKSMQENL